VLVHALSSLIALVGLACAVHSESDSSRSNVLGRMHETTWTRERAAPGGCTRRCVRRLRATRYNQILRIFTRGQTGTDLDRTRAVREHRKRSSGHTASFKTFVAQVDVLLGTGSRCITLETYKQDASQLSSFAPCRTGNSSPERPQHCATLLLLVTIICCQGLTTNRSFLVNLTRSIAEYAANQQHSNLVPVCRKACKQASAERR
jgi:hypothetical protein